MAISPFYQKTIDDFHVDFQKRAKKSTITTVAGVSLAIIASVVLVSASLCFLIPQPNAINAIVLPGLLPGGLLFLVSVPFFIFSVKWAIEKRKIRKEWNEKNKEIFTNSNVLQGTAEEAAKFLELLLPKNAHFIYQDKILSELNQSLQNGLPAPQKAVLDAAFNKVMEKIHKVPEKKLKQ